MPDETTCQFPDRDGFDLICGYPLPCPYHTVIIDTTKEPPTIEVPITRDIGHGDRRRLKDIARAIKEMNANA